MIPGLNPKKMQAVMKQLGMKSEDIEAERVIIEKSDNGKIIIENPQVTKINMAGQEQFQISGDVREETGEEGEIEDAENDEDLKQDIATIMEKTGKTDRDEIALCLEKNDGDIAKTILELGK